ncbi:MAG: hypothetical protein IKE40_02900 [Firmicutes bacterium]|nr:hypothetical protein [Bacillota bacterium]
MKDIVFEFDDKFNKEDGKCIIEECISEFDESEKEKEDTVRHVFSDPDNKHIEVVLTKVIVLNEIYSTQLNSNAKNEKEVIEGRKYHMDVLTMAKHIIENEEFTEWCNSDIEEQRLKAVDYIRRGKSKLRKSYHSEAYSFATKYCSWHNPEKYPIVDRYSKGMIYYLNQKFIFHKKDLKTTDLGDYKTFCEAFGSLQRYLNEECDKKFEYKDLDKFLWLYGKKNGVTID